MSRNSARYLDSSPLLLSPGRVRLDEGPYTSSRPVETLWHRPRTFEMPITLRGRTRSADSICGQRTRRGNLNSSTNNSEHERTYHMHSVCTLLSQRTTLHLPLGTLSSNQIGRPSRVFQAGRRRDLSCSGGRDGSVRSVVSLGGNSYLWYQRFVPIFQPLTWFVCWASLLRPSPGTAGVG